MLSEREARLQIIEVGQLLEKNGLVVATDGNISIRLGNRVLITPKGSQIGKLKTEELVVINMDGDRLEGPKYPSSELLLHLEIYKYRADVKAVVHAHPPKCVAASIAGLKLTCPIIPEIVLYLGSVPTLSYGTPGTPEIFKDLEKYIDRCDVFNLERHGAVCIGKELQEAFYKLQKLEYFAGIYLEVAKIGHAKCLNKSEVAKLMEIRDKHNISHPILHPEEFCNCIDECEQVKKLNE